MQSIKRLKSVSKKIYDYVRYDLKEIAFPSSMPDPPDMIKRKKLTWKERGLVLKEATRLYAVSWVRDIGPELKPHEHEYEKDIGDDEKHQRKNATDGKREPSTLEDLAVAARGGMETLRPALQHLYMTRASAYRDSLQCFIQGYQEGLTETIERKGENTTDTLRQEDVSKKST